MAGRILAPINPALDGNGAPIPGASLFTFVSGENTAKSTYKTAALDEAHPNPVIADAAGRFPEIWAETGESYRLIARDDGGAIVYGPVDDIQPVGEADGAIARNFGAGGGVRISGSVGEITFAAQPAAGDTGGKLTIEGKDNTELTEFRVRSGDIVFEGCDPRFDQGKIASYVVAGGSATNVASLVIPLGSSTRQEIVIYGATGLHGRISANGGVSYAGDDATNNYFWRGMGDVTHNLPGLSEFRFGDAPALELAILGNGSRTEVGWRARSSSFVGDGYGYVGIANATHLKLFTGTGLFSASWFRRNTPSA